MTSASCGQPAVLFLAAREVEATLLFNHSFEESGKRFFCLLLKNTNYLKYVWRGTSHGDRVILEQVV